ncbi:MULTISPECIES: hypothetical protein [unclassified Mesorhizobium]|nr:MULTISPECIES: hypothetical protein [unclassified Mesorhizobium]
MSETKKYVEGMIAKAGKSEKSEDAMRFSQAACNAANAMATLDHIPRKSA